MVLRHISILNDHPQGVCLYLAKVTELFKRFEEFFKFKTPNLKSRWLNPVLWQQYCNRRVLWPLWCHALEWIIYPFFYAFTCSSLFSHLPSICGIFLKYLLPFILDFIFNSKNSTNLFNLYDLSNYFSLLSIILLPIPSVRLYKNWNEINAKYFIFAFYFTDFEIVVLKGAADGGGGQTWGCEEISFHQILLSSER